MLLVWLYTSSTAVRKGLYGSKSYLDLFQINGLQRPSSLTFAYLRTLSVKMIILLDVTPCSFADCTGVFEEGAASMVTVD
jgi:hypothetical protein